METKLHKALASLFAVCEGGSLSADETETINAALSQADPADIPESQVQNVKDYIDTELLHNQVSGQTRCALERLYERL